MIKIILAIYIIIIVVAIAMNDERLTVSIMLPVFLVEPFLLTPLLSLIAKNVTEQQFSKLESTIPRNSSVNLIALALIFGLQSFDQYFDKMYVLFFILLLIFTLIRYSIFRLIISFVLDRVRGFRE